MVVIIYVRDLPLQQRRIGFDVGFNFFKSTFLLKKHKKITDKWNYVKRKTQKNFSDILSKHNYTLTNKCSLYYDNEHNN